MYDVTPADAKAVFELNKDKQNACVQDLMNKKQLVVEESNGEWRIAFTAPSDIKKVGNLKVDIYDANGYDATDKNRKPDAEELWTVARPDVYKRQLYTHGRYRPLPPGHSTAMLAERISVP